MSRAVMPLLMLTAIASGALPRASARAETVYLPVRSVPRALEPSQLKLATDNFIFRQVAEGLFVVGDGFQIDPRLAASADWDASRTTLRVTLREATWSDGTPVTTAQVVDSLRRCVRTSARTLLSSLQAIQGADGFIAGKSGQLPGVRALDARSIELRLTRPAPLLLDDLAQAECHILKPAADGSWDLLKGALGSGPYTIDALNASAGELAIARRAAGGSSPERAVFRATDDFGDFSRLRSWVTMTVGDTPPAGEAGFSAIEFSDLGTHQLVYNNSSGPFRSRDLRRAVSLALDIEALAAAMGWERERLQAGLVPFGMRGFRPRSAEAGNPAARLREARALLARHGYAAGHPLAFDILLPKLPGWETEARAWPGLFKGAAIQPRVVALPYAEVVAANRRGRFQALRVTKFAGSVENHRLLSSYLSGSDYNSPRAHEPRCDSLVRQSIRTEDRDKRFGLYDAADRCFMDAAVLVPLSSFQPGYVILKKPWKLKRSNRYLLYPYWVSEWSRS
jgi:ABC-type oligopeptide transport system substrate-binding subunit